MPTNFAFTDVVHANNFLASYYASFLSWMANSFYPEFKTKIISTYDKAVLRLNNKVEHNTENKLDTILPTIILDPSGDLNVDDRVNYLWKYSNLAPGAGSKMFDPFYVDQNVKCTAVFNRFIGTFEVILLLRSLYEYLDMRVYGTQFFTSLNRYTRPVIVNTFLIIPDELVTTKYQDINGNLIGLNWASSNLTQTLVVNMNQNKYTVPLKLTPLMKLTGISDNSTKLSGNDLESFSITFSFEYEIELPVYITIESNFKLKEKPKIDIIGSFINFIDDDNTINSQESNVIIINNRETILTTTTTLNITPENITEVKTSGITINNTVFTEEYVKVSINGVFLSFDQQDYIVTEANNNTSVTTVITFAETVLNQIHEDDVIVVQVYDNYINSSDIEFENNFPTMAQSVNYQLPTYEEIIVPYLTTPIEYVSTTSTYNNDIITLPLVFKNDTDDGIFIMVSNDKILLNDNPTSITDNVITVNNIIEPLNTTLLFLNNVVVQPTEYTLVVNTDNTTSITFNNDIKLTSSDVVQYVSYKENKYCKE